MLFKTHTTRFDKGNRCIVWADAQTGVALRAERQFIHNSKITSSAINEKKALSKSRQGNKPQGRYMGMPQMFHQLLGHSDIHTTLKFEQIESRPFEYRATTRIKLDRNGNIIKKGGARKNNDVACEVSDSCLIREKLLPRERHFTEHQRLILQPPSASSASYDKITLFGLRPVELLEMIPRVREYYEWFFIEDVVMKNEDISKGLAVDVKHCHWIDGLGRRVLLRKQACEMAAKRLTILREGEVKAHTWTLRCHLLKIIEDGCEDPAFIKDDVGEQLPVVVFSRISPNRSTNFLLHIMLVLGEFETEMELRTAGSMKKSLAKAKLIPSDDLENPEALKIYARGLTKRVVDEILPLQPVSMPQMDNFIVKTGQLIYSVLLRDTIPITDLPPSILTELFNEREKDLVKEWKRRTESQLDSMLNNLGNISNLPTKDEVLGATKIKNFTWDPMSIPQFEAQTDESYEEQRMALSLGVNAVNMYSKQFCNGDYTKGVLNNGAPGAGKTFVLQAAGLYAMTRGLRVMSTCLMAVRAIAIGGYHLHRLFQWEVGKNANLFRLGEVSTIVTLWHNTLLVTTSHCSVWLTLFFSSLSRSSTGSQVLSSCTCY